MDSYAYTYSFALYDLIDKSKREDYVNTLKEISLIFKNEKDFFRLLSGYSLSFDEKEIIIDKVFKNVELPYLKEFLKLIVKRHRCGGFTEILENFESLVNSSIGIKEGLLYSAFPLKEKQLKEIQNNLEKYFNCKVKLTTKIDPELIGGVKVAIDGKVFDGSLKTKISNLKKELMGGSRNEN